ncbi:hypothetical protein [Helicobacter mesocricetorum]|uniref:hypothetical protein n=1 Tax=Helicobacter mesocricetorum TaxID=87012 RepID=UPI000CF0A770|nr:hypothetical protein [Helicobacter mesocricetorum]
MVINQGLGALNDVFNEANRLLSNEKKASISSQKLDKITPKTQESPKNEENAAQQERTTYGLISLELMNDEQYRAFQRVTASMSHNEKISIAQMLTRAGNLNVSVERIKQQEKNLAQEEVKGFLGITQQGWENIAKDFQNNLNNLNHDNNLYSKTYNKNPTSNYNDILRKNQDAKTQRILREFAHAIHLGNTQIDTLS